jgi:hypothetical protein
LTYAVRTLAENQYELALRARSFLRTELQLPVVEDAAIPVASAALQRNRAGLRKLELSASLATKSLRSGADTFETPVLHGFRNMLGCNRVGAAKICNRASDASDAI